MITSIRHTADMNKNVFYIGLLGLILIGLFFYLYSLTHPVCCDANYYLSLAKDINLNGIESFNDQVRTWGYPWFLSIVVEISSFINVPLHFSIFFIQLVLYYLAILYCYNSLVRINGNVAITSYIFLCFNVFAIPYSVLTLTDSVYLTLILVFYAQMFCLLHQLEKTDIDVSKLLAWMSFVVCVNIVIRPASAWMLVPLFCLISYAAIRRQIHFLQFSCMSVLAVSPLIIQMAINTIHYGKYTFLPVIELGELQIKWGIQNIKYGTWLGGGAPENYYPSTALIDNSQSDLGLIWYLYNFFDGIKLLFVKFIGAFDFDYLVPYVYSKPYVPYLPSIMAFAFLWIGLLFTVCNLMSNRLGNLRFIPLIILVSWGAVSLSSALELRFTLPILLYFMITAPLFYEYFYKSASSRAKLFYVLGGIGFVAMCGFVSAFVRSQSSVLPYVQ